MGSFTGDDSVLRAVLDALPVGVVLVSSSMEIMYINDAASKFFSLEKDFLKAGKLCSDYRDTEFDCLVPSLEDNEEMSARETEIVKREGAVLPLLQYIKRITIGDDTAFLEVFIDITEQKKTERVLKKSEDHFRQLIEGSSDCILLVDTDGHILYTSPSVKKILGYEVEELIGDTLMSILIDEGPLLDVLVKSKTASHSGSVEVKAHHSDGSIKIMEGHYNCILDEDGDISVFIINAHDITKRKELEDFRLRIEQIIRHDLKTPLNSIMGFPQIILMDDNLTEVQKNYVKKIETAAKRMLEQINISLELYKVEEGTYKFVPQSVDVVKNIEDVLEALSGKIEGKGINVLIEQGEWNSDVRPSGKASFFRAALSNLIVNAMEAEERGSTLQVVLRHLPQRGEAEISVRNKTPVPEAIRDEFFSKFVTSGKASGTGLGTYSAKLFVEAMEGKLSLETDDETGTIVTITLPLFS